MSAPDAARARLDDALAEGISESTFRRRWAILATLCLGLMTAMIANMSLNLALPDIAVDFELTQLQLTWVVEAFALVFAALLFIAAAIADRYGRKRVMMIGLVIFVAASIYAPFFATTGAELIASRAVMGVGGALVMPTTLSLVNVVFPSRERPRAIAIWSAVAGVGMMIGSVLTGVLLHFFDWHSAFLLGAVFGIVSLVVAQVIVPESVDEKRTPVDWVGGALVTIALAGLVYTIMEAPSHGFDEPLTVAAAVAAALALAAFIAWERRARFPLLDLSLFRRSRFTLSVVSVTLTFFAMMGAFFGMTQIFQLVMGYDALATSLAFIPSMLPMMIIGPMIPRLVERVGTRWTVVPGLVLIAGGFLLMTTWPTVPSYWDFLLAMSTITLGMAMVMTPATNLLMASVPRNRSGMGSAMNDTTRELGASLGIAVLGSMIANAYTANIGDVAAQLPGEAARVVEDSLAGALAVTDQMGPAGAAIAEAARAAFMDANQHAMLISAIIAAATAVLMLVALPRGDKSLAAAEQEQEQEEDDAVVAAR
ncbi:antiseptic resistance protein [Demequina sediminis]|uniref:Antiseptic resistance protein n=1 Tax=Demequina sediminis TaxID=1930058 RepID=A0ABP9WDU7_9MICO|nr:MFS transporter [Demequina sediminis]BDZ61772.1 MFS transporter [Demequina sediminis]